MSVRCGEKIIYKEDIDTNEGRQLSNLYSGSHDYYSLFINSYLKLYAFDKEKLVGAVRVISEGVETALLVDLATASEYEEVKKELLSRIEEKLSDRRVMVYSGRDDLDFYEEAGYGRCKNAWTYFNSSLDEADFLPAGYKYENEFISYSVGAEKKLKEAAITYKEGEITSGFEEVNELLTKAFFGKPHDISKTTEAFTNSQYFVSAYDDEKLVGVARAVSDNDRYATILNVAVDPEYQGLSIGKNIVLRLSEIIRADIVVLNTHPGAVGFYNRLTQYRRNRYVFEKFITKEERAAMPPERRAAMFTPKGYKFPDEY